MTRSATKKLPCPRNKEETEESRKMARLARKDEIEERNKLLDKYSDITLLTIDGKEIKYIKYNLALHCAYFRTYIIKDNKIKVLYSSNIIKILIELIDFGSLFMESLKEEEVWALIKLCNEYIVSKTVKECIEQMLLTMKNDWTIEDINNIVLYGSKKLIDKFVKMTPISDFIGKEDIHLLNIEIFNYYEDDRMPKLRAIMSMYYKNINPNLVSIIEDIYNSYDPSMQGKIRKQFPWYFKDEKKDEKK